jgi:hypothetical protein
MNKDVVRMIGKDRKSGEKGYILIEDYGIVGPL